MPSSSLLPACVGARGNGHSTQDDLATCWAVDCLACVREAYVLALGQGQALELSLPDVQAVKCADQGHLGLLQKQRMELDGGPNQEEGMRPSRPHSASKAPYRVVGRLSSTLVIVRGGGLRHRCLAGLDDLVDSDLG